MPIVSLVKCENEEVDRSVNEAIDLIDGLKTIKGSRRVVLKPNLCATKSSDSGATTDPRIIESLIKKINSAMSCSIDIVETNNSSANANRTFDYLGYSDIPQRHENVRCINLSNDSRVRMHIDGDILSSMLVPESMIYSDCLVSVAKLKTHVDYLYTGVLKNQYGFLLGPRGQYHGFMSKVLVDLNRFYRPDLCIIDGLIGMEGFGPTGGNPKHVGVVIASKDPVAADTVAAQVMRIDPSKIEYLKYAERRGMGTSRNINVVGSSVADVAASFTFIPARYYLLGRSSLSLQKFSRYVRNFGELVGLARSALSTVGLSAIEKRMSYHGLVQLATDTIFRLHQ